MKTVEIFDPPMGCGVGSCGPDGEGAAELLATVLSLLESKGVVVSRYNLGHEPEMFSCIPLVKAAVQKHGIAILPIVLVNGQVVCQRSYPTRRDLSEHFPELAS